MPVSVLVNSCDDQRFRAFEQRFLGRLDLPLLEAIRIPNARSMAEGYNRGADRAAGEWLFFCHDDIGLLGHQSGEAFRAAMAEADMFGPCGTRRLVSGNWYDGGQPFNAGSVVAPDPSRPRAYRLELFGSSRRKLSLGVQALDGLFIACTRRVFDAIRGFDDARLKGFHTYDVDFSFRAYLAGFKCVVANHLLLLHDSNVAEFSAEKLGAWERDQKAFIRRFGRYLSGAPGVRQHRNIPLKNPEDGPRELTRALRWTWPWR